MTSLPSPPNRRRHRIVVVTVAVLVLGLGWWFWPRVDQRLFGNWEHVESDGGESECYLRFDPSGTVLITQRAPLFFRTAPDALTTMRWTVRNNRLVLAVIHDAGLIDKLRDFVCSVLDQFEATRKSVACAFELVDSRNLRIQAPKPYHALDGLFIRVLDDQGTR